jgi:hypothetical protein
MKILRGVFLVVRAPFQIAGALFLLVLWKRKTLGDVCTSG